METNHQKYLDTVYQIRGKVGETAFNETFKRTGFLQLANLAKKEARRSVRKALLDI